MQKIGNSVKGKPRFAPGRLSKPRLKQTSLTRLHRSGWRQKKVWDLVTAGFIGCWALAPTTALAVGADQTILVQPTVETQPPSGDADDPAIWIHPVDPSLSLIVGTSKSTGLGVYDLAGNERQIVDHNSGMNNVDLRYNFPLGGKLVDLVTTGNRTTNSIGIYRVDVRTRKIVNVAARLIKPGISTYGSCMYRSHFTGKFHYFVNSKSGEVEQWELFDDGSGKVDAIMVRGFDVGSQTEGCVADDEYAYLYIGEEDVGIWKYGAQPSDGTARSQVDTTAPGGHVAADVEGLTLYYTIDGTGYLIASSQGSNEYVVYERKGTNAYVMTFKIGAANGVDRVTGTDGIDVSNVPLGPAFPKGLFVAQDDSNDVGSNNFKLVPWEAIANLGFSPLKIDTSWDPRRVGAPPPAPPPTYSYIQCPERDRCCI